MLGNNFWLEFLGMFALLLNGAAFLVTCIYVSYMLFPEDEDED